MSACPVCVEDRVNLGRPSEARWVGPDGEAYCSMHFVGRFGHAEKLVRVEDYVPPAEPKAPAPRRQKEEQDAGT
jgi:hypothetical protein